MLIMKHTFLLVTLVAMYFTVNAQRKARYASSTRNSEISVGLEAGLPVGQNGKPYSYLIGGSVQYETKPDADLGITVNGGYLHYPVKKAYEPGSVGFVPLLAGVKYYFSPMAFFHAQLGAAIGTSKGQGTGFAYTPGIGVKLSSNIDAELKYVGISTKGGTLDNVGLRVAYIF
jgi:hypothetical protein